jgi:hypothetical protein
MVALLQRFSCLCLFALMFGRSVIPKPLFAVLLLVLVTAFAALWTWAAYVIPPAAVEKMRKLNYHPDADVRALQKGEMTIEEYARRKADAAAPVTDLPIATASASASGQPNA